ncbi:MULTISPECIES: enolase C-terminal domain-like protein [Brevibacterium]|uniref:Enolase C-terminal domain-like protein n=3 Tax=Brevibacterium TaxID=1696 RepID=A0ABP9U3S4_9MICO|nr:enolase C-terminal domain-like protein [Brevibacterium casei]MBE4694143.1 fuconate dehydratase [Brevibacterium casei]MBY3577266.1 fuconate dehydratase [Brevibacterium casei]MCT2184221.1 fuconate dehydratase [Brevibacterium casei]MCT2356841.1 fuconate dehydratase [Brevibacterium casei]MDH5148976.1 enolase C-terminal domain-like protein [Brevibacterium casei]
MPLITDISATDVRFPTSLELDGSDAVNVDPDYSAAYVTIRAGEGDAAEVGHGLVFTAGRGNELIVAAVESYAALLIGRELDDLLSDLGAASALLVHDSQLRWLGPEKGVTQMAAGALVSALWDMAARRAGKPLWRYLAELPAEDLVAAIDFTHIRNALTEEEALEILRAGEAGLAERIAALEATGFPAYTTSPGWLGYDDEKLVRLAKEAVAEGFTQIKLKVGGSLEDDRRRLALAREAVGPDVRIAIDANQKWETGEAIDWVNALAEFDPYWIEEPTSTDEILGHAEIRRGVAPVKVATGEAVHNRIMFKQLLQAEAIDILQLDSTRVAGVNENLAILLLARKFGIPVCPHAGGVGLCELVQHYSFFDFARLSGTEDGRVIEFVDHLHEHFVAPVSVVDGRYQAPTAPGTSAEMVAESVAEWTYPTGPGWVRTGDRAAVGSSTVDSADKDGHA